MLFDVSKGRSWLVILVVIRIRIAVVVPSLPVQRLFRLVCQTLLLRGLAFATNSANRSAWIVIRRLLVVGNPIWIIAFADFFGLFGFRVRASADD
jgi:hypothetical protein